MHYNINKILGGIILLNKTLFQNSKHPPYFRFLGFSGLSFLFFWFLIFSPASVSAKTGNDFTKKNSIKSCAQCHEDMIASFKGSIHGELNADCTDCHGYSAKHIETGDYDKLMMVAFKKESAISKTKQCLKCHTGSFGQYMNGEHSKAGIDCTKCHSIHKGKNKTIPKHPSKLCISCHIDVASEFELNEHHRIKEGIMECTSCHNPHVPATRQKLGGFKDEICFKCHRDKSGPFVYEHMGIKTEGCSVCHETHGSPNRHMLKHQSVRELCLSCHSEVPNWHLRFLTSDTNCANCHSSIHGSNLDKLFLK